MGILADWQVKRDVKITPFAEGQKSEGSISWGLGSYGYDLRAGYKFKLFSNTHCVEIDPKNFDQRAFVDVNLTPRKHNWLVEAESMRDPRFLICTHCEAKVPFDPAEGPPDELCETQPPAFVRIPPNSFALAESLEEIEVPRDCLALVVDKSTYRRCGILMGATVLEPEWRGVVTLEITNSTPLPARIYAGEGIAQVLFFRTDGYRESLKLALEGLADRVSLYGTEDIRIYFCHAYDMVRLGHARGGTCKVSYADRKGRYQAQSGIVLPHVSKGDK